VTHSTPNDQTAMASVQLPRLAMFVARHRRSLLMRKFAGLCHRYLNCYENLNYDMRTNGEFFVLESLARFQPRILFDVGANVGEWSLIAKSVCATAEIYAFEISPPTYQMLAARTGRLADVHCQNFGLSDLAGPVRIRHYAGLPALTTTTDYPHPFAFAELEAKVTTGDAFTAAKAIEHIDLLKIDVEGMEERVLRGFSVMLARKAIDLVQFEYGRVNIVNRFLLRDFYRFFGEQGYVVGKIYPNYVDFREYDLADENFIGPNYLACRKDKMEFVQAFNGVRRPR